MPQPLLKKQIAAAAGISPRTMRRHREKFAWLERCKTRAPGRPTYNPQRVQEELRKRNII